MASLAEFYITTLWSYRPEVIKQVINDLTDMGFDHAEFTYDSENDWFKVICREDEAHEIRGQFDMLARSIEEEAFDKYEDDILNLDDTLMTSFTNEWFSQSFGDTSPDPVDEPDEEYCRPKALTMCSHAGEWIGEWNDLESETVTYTVLDIMTDNQSEEIEKELGVTFSSALGGKLVYISGQSEESVAGAQKKLSVMLAIKKLLPGPLQAKNVLYVDNYEDPSGPNFTVDIRYLANIDPKLASSTLLDRVTVDNLEEAYKTVYRKAASLRLCSWDPEKDAWVSLLGPKVEVGHKDRTLMENRPLTHTIKFSQLMAATRSTPSFHPGSYVKNWIEKLELDDVGFVITGATRPVLDGQPAGRASSAAATEDLIDLTDGQANMAPEDQHQVSTTRRDLSASFLEEPEMSSGNPTSQLESSAGRGDEISFTGDDCLVDCLAAVKTTTPTDALRRSILWTMPSLIPSPRSDDEDGDGRSSESGIMGFQTRNSDALLVTKEFVDDVEAAMVGLLEMGPYRRGRVAVRAELGRAILEEVDDSGLAFNDASTPSDGWKKSLLVKSLNQNYGTDRGIHFTKVLSTFACDVEDMINTTDAKGARLWSQEPYRIWTVYSFYCGLGSRQGQWSFVLDVEHDGTREGQFSCSIRPRHDLPSVDKPMPVYVHAARHHWDVQIVTTHVKPDDVEGANIDFANTLLESLRIQHKGRGSPEVQFAECTDFAFEVKDVRVLTKWRHWNLNNGSALEITEVQQLEIVPYAEGEHSYSWDWDGRLARHWSQKRAKQNRDKKEFPRWYEAAVVSLELEELCQKNSSLKIGEKADWDAQDLKAHGNLRDLYGPALQMVCAMDHIGRHDDNHLSKEYGRLLLRENAMPYQVPGTSRAQEQTPGRRGRSRQTVSDVTSPGSRAASSRSSSVYRSSRAPPKYDQPGFW